jgi:hypothetical protein
VNNEYSNWNPEDEQVIAFFAKFPVKNKTDSKIVACDLDLLFFSIKYFSLEKNRDKFTESYIQARRKESWFQEDYADKVSIPFYFFKGYFHPWGKACLSGIRVGNPRDPMYKYSYEVPSTRSYTIRLAFEKGSIPCPNCFLDQLLLLYQVSSDNYR